MKNKIKYLIIGLILSFILGFLIAKIINNNKEIPQDNKQIVKENITPLMYEITKEGSTNKIYLFGSIHVANTNKLNFPNYIVDAFNNSHYLACEFDLVEYQKNQDNAIQMVYDMMYSDDSKIKDHLKPETYNKLVNFLKEREMYTEVYEIYKPMFFESLITNLIINDAKIKTNDGIDTYFLNKAKENNKKILEIETPDYQSKLLLSFNDQLYDLIISNLIDNYQEEVQSLINLYNSWKDGNIEKIIQASNDELEIKDTYTEEEKSLIKDYNKKLIEDRNITMTDKLIEYFNNNYDTFYMVGAAHLVGDKGIAKLLQEKGYNVKIIH